MINVRLTTCIDQIRIELRLLGVIGEGEMNLPNFDDDWVNDTGANDTFVISYDINREWYFVNFIGGGDQAIGNDIATAENGHFFVVGEFNKSVFFPEQHSVVVNQKLMSIK